VTLPVVPHLRCTQMYSVDMFKGPFVRSGRDTIAADLYNYLRQSIVQGDLEPGTRMVEQTIARETFTSRTPVRDALRQLEIAGFVQNDGRGLVVAEFSSAELREAWVVMETLQCLASKLAAVHRTDMDLLELNHLIEAGRVATRAKDGSALVETNRRFHAAVHRASGNRFLFDVIQPMVLRIETLQDFSSARRRVQAQKEHEAIAAAIKSQDVAEAENAMFTHLQNQLVHTLVSVG
jgi:DNA-binding GntR family transcriptional regulator